MPGMAQMTMGGLWESMDHTPIKLFPEPTMVVNQKTFSKIGYQMIRLECYIILRKPNWAILEMVNF